MDQYVQTVIEKAINNSIATNSICEFVFPSRFVEEDSEVDDLFDIDWLVEDISRTQGYLVDYIQEDSGSYLIFGWTNATKKDQIDWRIRILAKKD
ncbi:MAG: hypothetical protein WCG27_05390 [Pseudomonadota bacterium]